jgi:hypothetical protein
VCYTSIKLKIYIKIGCFILVGMKGFDQTFLTRGEGEGGKLKSPVKVDSCLTFTGDLFCELMIKAYYLEEKSPIDFDSSVSFSLSC